MAADKERDPGASEAEIGKYLDILAKDPNSRVFAPLAEAYRKAGLFDDAVEIALEGLKVHPNYLGGRVALGRAYFEKKQYPEAAAELEKVAKAAPDNIIAHKVLGQIAFQRGDLPSAEKAFKMVLLLDPRDEEAKQFLANLGGGAPEEAPPPPPATIEPPSAPSPQPAALLEIPLPTPSGPSPEALALDEIPRIDDFDLGSETVVDGSAPEELFPDDVASPPPAEAPAGPVSFEEFGEEMPLEIAEPEPWPAGPETSAAADEKARPPDIPVGQPQEADGGMELEVFTRVPWHDDAQAVDVEPPSPTAPQPSPAEEAEAAESPFEVFGRNKGVGSPQSTKGEQTAFGEIDLESTAHEPVVAEPETVSDSPFEIFTREPAHRAAPPPQRADRGSEAGPREIEIETTAFTPSDDFAPEDVADSTLELDEELPSIDLTREVDFDTPDEPTQAHWVAPTPEADSGPDLDLDVDLDADLDVNLDPGGFPPPTPEETVQLEPDLAVSLDDEIPPVDLGQEAEVDLFAPESEESVPEGESPAVPPGEQAARGVFDTGTLAEIYVNQGFYGRAAEIYERLIAQRPDDTALRGKLEMVRTLEREAGGGGAQTAAEAPMQPPAQAPAQTPPPPTAAPAEQKSASSPGGGPDRMISQLQTLLEAFKGGRPR